MRKASDWLKGSFCVTLKITQVVNQPFFFSFTTTPLLLKTTNQIKFWLLMRGVIWSTREERHGLSGEQGRWRRVGNRTRANLLEEAYWPPSPPLPLSCNEVLCWRWSIWRSPNLLSYSASLSLVATTKIFLLELNRSLCYRWILWRKVVKPFW